MVRKKLGNKTKKEGEVSLNTEKPLHKLQQKIIQRIVYWRQIQEKYKNIGDTKSDQIIEAKINELNWVLDN